MSTGQFRAIRLELFDMPEFQELSVGARLTYIVLIATLGPSGIEIKYPEALVHELAPRTGLSPRQVAAAMGELEGTGWVRRDGLVIWCVRQLEMDPFQSARNPNHVPRIATHVRSLPSPALVGAFMERYASWFGGIANPIGDGMTAGTPPPIQNPSPMGSRSGKREEGKGRTEERAGKGSSSGEGAAVAARGWARRWARQISEPPDDRNVAAIAHECSALVSRFGEPQAYKGWKFYVEQSWTRGVEPTIEDFLPVADHWIRQGFLNGRSPGEAQNSGRPGAST
jgi:hypothetical protein